MECTDLIQMRLEYPRVKILGDCMTIEPTRIVLPFEEIEDEEIPEREEHQPDNTTYTLTTEENSTPSNPPAFNPDWIEVKSEENDTEVGF